jgi:hypothetical protein
MHVSPPNRIMYNMHVKLSKPVEQLCYQYWLHDVTYIRKNRWVDKLTHVLWVYLTNRT